MIRVLRIAQDRRKIKWKRKNHILTFVSLYQSANLSQKNVHGNKDARKYPKLFHVYFS